MNIFTLPDLFAGRMHSLLFRKWKNRVKGRDWFDLEWYIRKGVPLHIQHLEIRARDSGNWNAGKMNPQALVQLLHHKIEEVSMDKVIQDVLPFIPDGKVTDIWSKKYFHDLASRLQFE